MLSYQWVVVVTTVVVTTVVVTVFVKVVTTYWILKDTKLKVSSLPGLV